MSIVQVAPGITSLAQRKGGFVHAFLIEDQGELTVIDTLFDVDAGLILAEIARMGRTVRDLKHLILTHAHRSHLGGLARLKELSGAPIYAHEWEADIIAGERKAQSISLWPRQPLRVYPLQAGLALGLGKHPPVPVDHLIHEGDQIGPFKVIYAPGHSPGHLTFYWEQRKMLVAGDAIATWPRFELGWPAFTLNPRQHLQSLRRLAELDVEILGVGHGDPLPSGGGRRLRAALPPG
jgi:glyoxylase-like metal-dependent hydrolase (beta-lactamase superfamily II)